MKNKDMDLVGHFEELRKSLIITLGAFILLFILSFIFVQDIYNLLEFLLSLSEGLTSFCLLTLNLQIKINSKITDFTKYPKLDIHT